MITVTRLTDYDPEHEGEMTTGFVIVIDHVDSMESFKQVVHRGVNLWPDASPEVKAFADELIEGRVLQDYWAQANIPNPRKQGK